MRIPAPCTALLPLVLVACSSVPSRIALPALLAGTAPLAVQGRMAGGERIGFGPFSARAQFGDAILERGGPFGAGVRRGSRPEWQVTVERDGIPLAQANCGAGIPPHAPPSDGAEPPPPRPAVLACTALAPGGDTLAVLEVRARADDDSSITWDGQLPMLVGSVALEDRHLALAGGAFLRGMACLGDPVCTWSLTSFDGRVLAAVETNAGGWVYPASDLTAGEFDLVGIIGSILLLRPDPGGPPAGPDTP